MMNRNNKMQVLAMLFAALFVLPTTAEATQKVKKEKRKMVLIETTVGNIKIALYNETPLHRDNFLKLVSEKFYDNVLFHRVIKEFMIQAGDPESKEAEAGKALGSGGVGYTIPAEIVFPKFCHKRGALAAARKSDAVNPNKESSGCQFYIVDGRTFTDQEIDHFEIEINRALQPAEPLKYSEEQRLTYKLFGGAPHLDGQYTVFGEVVKGYDVLRKIAQAPTDRNDRPNEDIRILSTKIVRK